MRWLLREQSCRRPLSDKNTTNSDDGKQVECVRGRSRGRTERGDVGGRSEDAEGRGGSCVCEWRSDCPTGKRGNGRAERVERLGDHAAGDSAGTNRTRDERGGIAGADPWIGGDGRRRKILRLSAVRKMLEAESGDSANPCRKRWEERERAANSREPHDVDEMPDGGVEGNRRAPEAHTSAIATSAVWWVLGGKLE